MIPMEYMVQLLRENRENGLNTLIICYNDGIPLLYNLAPGPYTLTDCTHRYYIHEVNPGSISVLTTDGIIQSPDPYLLMMYKHRLVKDIEELPSHFLKWLI
jgi:hypothetical protein